MEAATARSTKIPVKMLKMANDEKNVYLQSGKEQVQEMEFPIKDMGKMFLFPIAVCFQNSAQ